MPPQQCASALNPVPARITRRSRVPIPHYRPRTNPKSHFKAIIDIDIRSHQYRRHSHKNSSSLVAVSLSHRSANTTMEHSNSPTQPETQPSPPTDQQRASRIMELMASPLMREAAQSWSEQRDFLRTELLAFWTEHAQRFQEFWRAVPPSEAEIEQFNDVRRAMVMAALEDMPESFAGPLLHCSCPELVRVFELLEQAAATAAEQPSQQSRQQVNEAFDIVDSIFTRLTQQVENDDEHFDLSDYVSTLNDPTTTTTTLATPTQSLEQQQQALLRRRAETIAALEPLLIARSCALLQFAIGVALLFLAHFTTDDGDADDTHDHHHQHQRYALPQSPGSDC